MIPRGVDIYLGIEPIDLRWGFDRLCGIVSERICWRAMWLRFRAGFPRRLGDAIPHLIPTMPGARSAFSRGSCSPL